jgi:hypothetical protein
MIAAGQTTFIPQSAGTIPPLMTMPLIQMPIIPWQEQNPAFAISQKQSLIRNNGGEKISVIWRP